MKRWRMALNQGLACVVILGVPAFAVLAMTAADLTQREIKEADAFQATPAPALLVLSKAESALAIVDPVTLKVVAKVATGPVPHEVAASADGRWAVVTNYGAHQDGTSLSAIDLIAQKEVHRVDLGAWRGPHGIVFFEGKAWFTLEGSKLIARYDPATNKVDWTFDIQQNRTHMLLIAPGGRRIYTANVNSDSISVLDKNAKGDSWSKEEIAVGKGPEGMDLSPNGKELWVANSHDGTVSIIDTVTKKVAQTLDVKTKMTNRVKFTPDGKLVFLSDLGSGDLVIWDAATRKEVKRLHLGKSVEGILMQPDGSRAFVAVTGDNKLAVVDLKTLAVTTTFITGEEPDGMAWRARAETP